MTRTVKQLFDLSGKTALVTGGSRGLGLQLAQAMLMCWSTTLVRPGVLPLKTIPSKPGTR